MIYLKIRRQIPIGLQQICNFPVEVIDATAGDPFIQTCGPVMRWFPGIILWFAARAKTAFASQVSTTPQIAAAESLSCWRYSISLQNPRLLFKISVRTWPTIAMRRLLPPMVVE